MPTDFARGPWDPNALHGGPVAALLARAVEKCEPDRTAADLAAAEELISRAGEQVSAAHPTLIVVRG